MFCAALVDSGPQNRVIRNCRYIAVPLAVACSKQFRNGLVLNVNVAMTVQEGLTAWAFAETASQQPSPGIVVKGLQFLGSSCVISFHTPF